MSPEAAAMCLFLGIVIDCWGLGGPRFAPLFDRVAFIFWVAVWAAGFANSGLTGVLSGWLDGAFGMLAGMFPNVRLFVGLMHIGPQIVGTVVFLVCLGAFLPSRVRVLGDLSKIEFDHLRQAGSALLAKTGGTVRTSPGGGVAVATGRSGGGWFRRIFPGSVNLGMVAVALMLVTTATIVRGGIGGLMGWCIERDVAVGAWLTHPFVASWGYS